MVLILLSAAAFAANDNTGTSPGNFLKLGGGTRPAAMGNAFVALADDINAIYWNPAGLTQLGAFAFSSMYAALPADMSYSNISLGTSIPRTSMSSGLSIDYVNAGQIAETTLDQPYGTGKYFTPSLFALTCPLAYRIGPLSMGFNVKMIGDMIGTSDALGYGIDAGMLWKINDQFSIGACGRDLTGASDVIPAKGETAAPAQGHDGLAPDYTFGAAYRLPFLALCLDYDMPSDDQAFFCLGAEYNFRDFFFGRIGFSTRSEEMAGNNFGAGVGLKLGILKIDYAYVPDGDLGVTRRISIGLATEIKADRAEQNPSPAPPSAGQGKAPSTPPPPLPPPTPEVKPVPTAEAIVVPSAEARPAVTFEANGMPPGLVPGYIPPVPAEIKPLPEEKPVPVKKVTVKKKLKKKAKRK
ncbi:MAG TPA: PorV/PorQ family protein [Candidatus Omnitrophota bacterium]|nr:PorV/PorQ family protein [Candidatus Omnitrophota bacterium]